MGSRPSRDGASPRVSASRPLGLYVHVPFCAARCSYCAFVTWVDRADQEAAYFDALEREVAVRARGATLDTVYFGGGTPSLPDPARLRRVLDVLRAEAELLPGAEITLEANPESVDEARASAWREAGFNRASVGVQSFDPRVLQAAERLHGPEGPAAAFRALRAAGFDNLSLDLIAGLPHESAGSLAETRRRALDLAPEHVSLYMLELDEAGKASPLAAAVRAGRVAVPSDDEVADWYEASVAELEAAGLRRYEISNFAREGRESRHNLKYWSCDATLGAGVAAHWFDGSRRRFNVSGFEAYVTLASSGGAEAPESAAAPPADVGQERVLLGLRLARGIDLSALDREHPGLSARMRPVLEEHASAGLVILEGGRARLSDRGMLLSNEVFQDVLAA